MISNYFVIFFFQISELSSLLIFFGVGKLSEN